MTLVAEAIRARLAALEPVRLDIRDDSARHAGHAGNRAGGGHFAVMIVSAQFGGKRPLERQRMVYHALGNLMTQEIHALSIDARTPEENQLTAKDN